MTITLPMSIFYKAGWIGMAFLLCYMSDFNDIGFLLVAAGLLFMSYIIRIIRGAILAFTLMAKASLRVLDYLLVAL